MKEEWLQELYPKLKEEELQEVKDRLSSYVELAVQIYQRLHSDPERYAEFKNLTAAKRHPNMQREPSSPP